MTKDPKCPSLMRRGLAPMSVIIAFKRSKIAVDEFYNRSIYEVNGHWYDYEELIKSNNPVK